MSYGCVNPHPRMDVVLRCSCVNATWLGECPRMDLWLRSGSVNIRVVRAVHDCVDALE